MAFPALATFTRSARSGVRCTIEDAAISENRGDCSMNMIVLLVPSRTWNESRHWSGLPPETRVVVFHTPPLAPDTNTPRVAVAPGASMARLRLRTTPLWSEIAMSTWAVPGVRFVVPAMTRSPRWTVTGPRGAIAGAAAGTTEAALAVRAVAGSKSTVLDPTAVSPVAASNSSTSVTMSSPAPELTLTRRSAGPLTGNEAEAVSPGARSEIVACPTTFPARSRMSGPTVTAEPPWLATLIRRAWPGPMWMMGVEYACPDTTCTMSVSSQTLAAAP